MPVAHERKGAPEMAETADVPCPSCTQHVGTSLLSSPICACLLTTWELGEKRQCVHDHFVVVVNPHAPMQAATVVARTDGSLWSLHRAELQAVLQTAEAQAGGRDLPALVQVSQTEPRLAFCRQQRGVEVC